jgi:hypothetical protein
LGDRAEVAIARQAWGSEAPPISTFDIRSGLYCVAIWQASSDIPPFVLRAAQQIWPTPVLDFSV